jgi:hypothetical protein
MRSESRRPGLPASTKIVSPAGVTINVACAPSTFHPVNIKPLVVRASDHGGWPPPSPTNPATIQGLNGQQLRDPVRT